jgi:hypothetical protein
MTFTFRPAVRESTPVLIGLAGPSGGGKTYSALRLARGLVGPEGKIAFIDTEARRALHYASKFKFDHGEMGPPFTPERMREAFEAAEQYVGPMGAIVIDSMSHEYSGDGGLQEIAQEELERLSGGNPKRMEALVAPSWKVPKTRHKKLISRLLQCRAHLIFCLRAEEKIKFVKVKKQNQEGREYESTSIVPMGWQPIQEKNFMFEMTASFMLSDLEKHLPTPIKLQDQHAAFFPLNKPIDEQSGKQLAAWAAGGVVAEQPKQPETPPAQTQTNGQTPPPDKPTPTDFVLGLPMAWPAPTADRKAWNVACIAAAKEIDALPDAFHAERWEELNGESLNVLMAGANKDFYDRLMGKLMPKKEQANG